MTDLLTTPAPAPSQQPATSAAPAATPAASSSTPPATPTPAPAETTPAPAAAPAATPQNLVSAASGVLDIPDKFRVTRADGTIDHEATLQKALGSVTHLEKRLGSGDVPPENEAGYKLDYSAFPEGIKIDPEGEKAFLKRMHGSGLTNKQVQAVLNEYGSVIKQGIEIQKSQQTAQANTVLTEVETELKTAWGESNGLNIKAAVRGFNHLADEADKKDLQKIGIDPKVTYRILMKVLAKVGAGVTEDTPITGDGAGSGLQAELDALKKSDAYLKEDHVDHKATVAKVTSIYQRLYPEKK